MLRQANFTHDSIKFLKSLPAKQHRQISHKIYALLADPLPHDSKKMHGADDIFRADCGEYRIIYRFDDAIVYILRIGNRNDGEVYRGF